MRDSSQQSFFLQRPELREKVEGIMKEQESQFLKEFKDHFAIVSDGQSLIERQARMSDRPQESRKNLESIYPSSIKNSTEAIALIFVPSLGCQHLVEFTRLERTLKKTPEQLSAIDRERILDLMNEDHHLKTIEILAENYPNLPALVTRVLNLPSESPELAFQFALRIHKTSDFVPLIPRVSLTGIDFPEV
jgi:hypothetical protein